MAAAANVTTNFVTINGVIARNNLVTGGGGSRRLFSLPAARRSSLKPAAEEERAHELSIQEEFEQMPKLHAEQQSSLRSSDPGVIRVFATVAGAGRLNHLEHRLASEAPGLHISHRWERHQSIKAQKAD
jgi:hypothetical protein